MHTLLTKSNGGSRVALSDLRRESLEAQIRVDKIAYRSALRGEQAVEELREFFGNDADDLVLLSLSEMNLLDMLAAQRGLAALLDGWRIVKESCPGRSYRQIKKRAVEVAPDEFDFIIEQGRQFWVCPNGERLVAEVETDHDDRREEWSQIEFFVPRERHEWLMDLLKRLRKWIDENHFLRGAIFDACARFVRFNETVSWQDVMLPKNVRDAVDENCIRLLANADFFAENGIPLKRGIILHGPPGTGKTLTGRALAQNCNATFIVATPGMLDSGKDVRRVFEWGKRFAPSILFFEDFDMVAGNRQSRFDNERLGEFLSCIDGIDAGGGMIVIATTNNLHAIEPALKDRPNRFDCILEVPALSRELRREFLLARLGERAKGLAIVRIVKRTEGYTGAQLQELCRLAIFEAVSAKIAEGMQKPEKVQLEDAHFTKAFAKLAFAEKRCIGFQTDRDEEDGNEW